MYAVLAIISFILVDNKIDAAFQFLSCEAFLKSLSICPCLFGIQSR